MMDIKVRLKEAREAIKNKDYETSLKLSKVSNIDTTVLKFQSWFKFSIS